MIAVLTGDIVKSSSADTFIWVDILKQYFSTLGNTPTEWDIYRGDEFQLKTSPENALLVAIKIKALIKSVEGLDVRIAIGLGEETYVGEGISESNGSAYSRSGRDFETLKGLKHNLVVATSSTVYNNTLNLMLKLALNFMDNWSVVSAEITTIVLNNPDWSQEKIAEELGVKQSAVSQRKKRARLHLVLELLKYYKNTYKKASE